MPIALNLTLPLKQDAETQEKLAAFGTAFAEHVQPRMDKALRESELVHFARVYVIENRWLLVLTEFDGDPIDYSEFFRLELTDVFKFVLSLVEGAPPWEQIDNKVRFFEYMQKHNPASLGENVGDEFNRGYLFSMFDKTIGEIQHALETP
jgi:hypothetical protein